MDGWIELASASTDAGDLLVLRERVGIVELRCNGRELMSNRAHHSEEALAALACEHLARAQSGQDRQERWNAQDGLEEADRGGLDEAVGHGGPRTRVAPEGAHFLIGGLGLGYTLRAALDRLPASARVTVAELLPDIISWNHGPLAPFAGRPLADPRVTVTCTDVAALLRAAEPGNFDVILLDTDNGPDAVMLADNATLYASEGLRLIRRALRPSGALAVWSADPSPRFENTLRGTGFRWRAHQVPARGAPEDPLHTIYLAWQRHDRSTSPGCGASDPHGQGRRGTTATLVLAGGGATRMGGVD